MCYTEINNVVFRVLRAKGFFLKALFYLRKGLFRGKMNIYERRTQQAPL